MRERFTRLSRRGQRASPTFAPRRQNGVDPRPESHQKLIMTILPTIKTLRGRQGSWDVEVTYADGSKEVLPTAHQLFWKVDQTGPYYQRGPADHSWDGFRQNAKFADHVALLNAKKRVVADH